MPDASAIPQAGSFLAQLADSDVPCPNCGQNMRGTTTGQCTECGSAVTLQAIARGASRGVAPLPWFVALAASGVHLITSAEIYRSFGWGYINYGHEGAANVSIEIARRWLSTGFWTLIPLVSLFLLGSQVWFGRQPKHRQWIIALGLVALALVTHRRWLGRVG